MILLKASILLLSAVIQVSCLTLDELLPYGPASGDQALDKNSEDKNSVEAPFTVPFVFYQREFDSVFINENGLVSFQMELPSYYNSELPMDYPVIAPFYSDVDIREAGQIYWRVSRSQEDLRLVNSLISPRYRNLRFTASEVVVVTWDQVASFDRQQDKVNTFQLVMATDGSTSFAMFLYPEDGIQWIRGTGKNRNSADARAQAGIMFLLQDGAYTLLPFSGHDQIANVASWSNTDKPGLFLFRVGRIESLDDAQPPDTPRQGYDMESARDCGLGSTFCHSAATCSASASGFCCSCNQGWYGDGENCLQENQPQRVNGRVNGELNGVSIVQQDIHCYVVTNDGRTYTAISRVGTDIGYDLQGLVPLGTIISWLFASPENNSKNGFGLTGGKVNYTAEVRFPETGHSATIQANFKGMNVFDYLTAELDISGTLPSIPNRDKIAVEDQSIVFTKTEPGVVQARSEHEYRIEGNGKTVPFIVDQTARWNECEGGPMDEGSMKLMSSRNFIIYDADEEIVRYAMTSSVTALTGSSDPCSAANCGPHSRCLVSGDSYSCVCTSGYRQSSSGQCQDIDECMDRSRCGEHADCENLPGSFQCRCRQGYIGDGISCYREVSCEELNCSANSDCTINRFGQGECKCRAGYEGDGVTCNIIPSKVEMTGMADPAQMVMQTSTNSEGMNRIPVSHTFQVTNHGPFDVGHLVINVSWPLLDSSGESLLYLEEKPFITYTSSAGEVKEECMIDPTLVDPLGLKTNNRKRRDADIVYDDDYQTINSDYGQGMLYDAEDLPDYDYGHLTKLLLNTAPEEDDNDNDDDDNDDDDDDDEYGDEGFMDGGMIDDMNMASSSSNLPESSRVMQKPEQFEESERMVEQSVEAPTYEGQSYDRINFICQARLGVNEVGVLHINSQLDKKTIGDYQDISRFVLQSVAEIVETRDVKPWGSGKVEAETTIDIANPVFTQGPGQGIPCGDVECHKYASCHMVFGEDTGSKCQCPEGFYGDGVSSCDVGEPSTPPPPPLPDCRSESLCGAYAECVLEAESYVCKCRAGYYGDGRICAIDTSSESYPGPEPHYTTEASNLRDPDCVYGVCTCEVGYSFNGEHCLKNPVTGRSQYLSCSAHEDCGTKMECQFNRQERMYACTCKQGFQTADSGDCVSDGRDTCRVDSDCSTNQQCSRNRTTGRHECSCQRGYLSDGQSCYQDPNAGCDVLLNCHANAVCQSKRGEHQCRCDPGYTGNGTHCEKEHIIGCNVLDNCGRFAECQFNSREGGYRCTCDSARGFGGDGFSCSPITSCSSNPAVCDPNSDCVNPSADHHGCRCKPYFLGDGLVCEPAPRFQGNFLLVAQGVGLIKVPFSGKRSKLHNVRSKQLAAGIDVDCRRGDVYWTDTTNKIISVASVDGSNHRDFSSDLFSIPEGIAVDWVSRNLYVTDPGTRSITVVSIENKISYRLIEENVESPRGIALHPTLGKIYWTDWDRYGPRVEMANMDGTGRQVLVSVGIGEPNSIAVDYFNYEVCWADAGRREMNIKPKIDCIGANGSGRRTVVELPNGSYPYGIAITDSSILWTDWRRKYIHSVDKRTGARQKSIPYVLATIGKPYDLVNIPEECPNIENSCQGQPCGVNRMCLPNGTGTHVCR